MRGEPETGQLIAILRGVEPSDVLSVASVLVDAGFRAIEVPLNSPEPLSSIERLADKYGTELLIGAGTVLTETDVGEVFKAGGRLIVSPNTNPAIVRKTKELGLVSAPGFATPSEAFAALEAGADILKMFPAGSLGLDFLKAIKAVLPKEAPVFAVGGVGADEMLDFARSGADGFGLGSNLFRPGMALSEISERAQLSASAAADAFG